MTSAKIAVNTVEPDRLNLQKITYESTILKNSKVLKNQMLLSFNRKSTLKRYKNVNNKQYYYPMFVSSFIYAVRVHNYAHVGNYGVVRYEHFYC